jgi:gentisate 1,2-dioxygenase
MSGFVTRDETLPPTYSQALESHSLPPLWTALRVPLPTERGTAAVPHRWSWRGARPLLHEGARLVPLEPAERRVVIEGRGTSRVGEAELTWEPGDTFVAPPWHGIEHDNGSAGEPACLFSFNDEPAIRALGRWQDERP